MCVYIMFLLMSVARIMNES